ncbi:MAG: Smr/MutS family protein [Roseococcus sp.]|nr:Smr/MutS family protein [Roseococcus sp.]
MRRARALTEEERALWAAVTRSVRPLPGRAPPAAPPGPSVTVTPPPRPALPPPAPPPRLPPPEIGVGVQPPGLDAKRWRALRRGALKPERTLDLHGMTAARAHAAVRGFLLAAQAERLRVVCIVTGKGSSPEGGVLRRELPHWLNGPELRGLILGAAHPHKANAGAVHLLLRRAR